MVSTFSGKQKTVYQFKSMIDVFNLVIMVLRKKIKTGEKMFKNTKLFVFVTRKFKTTHICIMLNKEKGLVFS